MRGKLTPGHEDTRVDIALEGIGDPAVDRIGSLRKSW